MNNPPACTYPKPTSSYFAGVGLVQWTGPTPSMFAPSPLPPVVHALDPPTVTRQSIQDNRVIRYGGRKTERPKGSRWKLGYIIITAPREQQIEDYSPRRERLPDHVARRERTQLRIIPT